MKPSREGLNNALPNHYQGPVQFLPSKSLNGSRRTKSTTPLTSVISTGEENRQGGFDLDDKRIKYGIFPFWGLVDDNAAESTQLTQADVERLDTLCWRALKNQTTSRSKLGQEPRLYLRAEYESENYHIGGLHELLDLGEDSADSLRSVNDVVVDASDLVAALNNASDRIKTLHVVADDRINLEVDGETMHGDAFVDHLEDSGHDIHRIDVLEERDVAA